MPVQMGNQKVKTLCYNIIGDTVLSLFFVMYLIIKCSRVFTVCLWCEREHLLQPSLTKWY
jgi:hypothetical protein